MSVGDDDAFEYYNDPARGERAAGPAHRRLDGPLTRHVPVRFPAETIGAVQALAELDGMTVSAWIRKSVDAAVRDRNPERPSYRNRIWIAS